MAWGTAIRIELDAAERGELEARTRRRKIARADAVRAEIVLLAASGRPTSRNDSPLPDRRWRLGASGLPLPAWTAFSTSRVPARHARSATRRSLKW